MARVFGESKAYFLQSSIDKKPEVRKAGEKLEWRGFTFEILDMDAQRIDKVLVTLSGDARGED